MAVVDTARAMRNSAVATRQDGVVTRSQLIGAGMNQNSILAHVLAGRWTVWGDHVIVLHNAELTRRQLVWAALLDAAPPAALCSHTALELHGFRGFASEAEKIHLLVSRGAKLSISAASTPNLVVHESRRVQEKFHVVVDGVPCTSVARSAIDSAAWQPWPRFACAQLAAVVQQRLCTVEDLERTLGFVGRVRHKPHMREVLRDIRGGSDALSEIDLVRLCDRYRLQRPTQQVRRRDRDGKQRYLDAMWRLPDGRIVVLEVDGAHHLDIASWQDDMRRERAVVIDGAQVLRATSVETRVEPGRVAEDLIAIGIPRVVRS